MYKIVIYIYICFVNLDEKEIENFETLHNILFIYYYGYIYTYNIVLL